MAKTSYLVRLNDFVKETPYEGKGKEMSLPGFLQVILNRIKPPDEIIAEEVIGKTQHWMQNKYSIPIIRLAESLRPKRSL